jgi:hypothetical protein
VARQWWAAFTGLPLKRNLVLEFSYTRRIIGLKNGCLVPDLIFMAGCRKLQVIEPVPKPGWFWPGFWKNRSNRTKVRPGFSPKSKEAVPKTEVLEQPR